MNKQIPRSIIKSIETPDFKKRVNFLIPVTGEQVPKEVSTYFETIIQEHKDYYDNSEVEIGMVELKVIFK